ncbi:MAG: T9SS type A sorting domain-containing protein, partial [Bacteroidetes bacterium]|nr:T9SS type A sorting domain-containing protein [Bacteroidota bacterium]
DEVYTINTAGYNSGIYFIQVETSEGWLTRKVLIE